MGKIGWYRITVLWKKLFLDRYPRMGALAREADRSDRIVGFNSSISRLDKG